MILYFFLFSWLELQERAYLLIKHFIIVIYQRFLYPNAELLWCTYLKINKKRICYIKCAFLFKSLKIQKHCSIINMIWLYKFSVTRVVLYIPSNIIYTNYQNLNEFDIQIKLTQWICNLYKCVLHTPLQILATMNTNKWFIGKQKKRHHAICHCFFYFTLQLHQFLYNLSYNLHKHLLGHFIVFLVTIKLTRKRSFRKE